MIKRIGFNLFILLSIVFFPWQSYVLFIAAGFFAYDNFYEGILWGMLLDIISGTQADPVYWYTVYTATAYLFTTWCKPYILFYD